MTSIRGLHFAAGLSRSRVGLGLFVATTLLSLLALGSVHVLVITIVATSLFVSGVLIKPRSIPLAPTGLLLGLAAWSLMQSIPMPLAFLSYISPRAADIWSSALSPLNERTTTGSISLAPTSSVIEALKWVIYASAFLLAHSLTRRYGRTTIPLIVLGSGSVLAIASLGHWLADAQTVFGVYAPRFATAPGHVAPLLNPNNLGGYLVFAGLCGTGLLTTSSNQITQGATAAAIAICICTALTTQSRGAVASLAIGAVILGLFRIIHRARGLKRFGENRFNTNATILAVFAGVASAIFLVVVVEQHGFAELNDPSTEKFGLSYWGLDVVKDYPLTGVGRGAIGTVSFEYLSGRGFPSSQFGQTENFVTQWCAEWGAPVGLAACAGLCAALWSIGRQAMRSPMLQSSFAALVALILQNLVDLAFEVAGVMISLVALLGASLSAPGTQRSKAASHVAFARISFAVGPAAALAAAWYGAPTDVELRDDLRHLVVSKPNHATTAEVNAKLRSAMARFPADPFYPYLGAAQAMSSGSNPLPWFQKALLRNPGSGPTHLLLAEYMKARGNYNQALLHLRLAVEHDPGLMGAATTRAVSWQRTHSDLLRAVPGTPDLATRTLTMMAGKVSTPQAKLWLLREVLSRSPHDPIALTQTTSWLLRMTAESLEGCGADRAGACLDEASTLAKRLEAVQPDSSVPYEARASVLLYKKDPHTAERLLREACPARGGTGSCLSLWLKAAEATRDSDRFSSAADGIVSSGCARTASCYSWHLAIAQRAARNGWWAQALEHSSAAASLKPSTQVWMLVGQSAGALGLESRARRAYQKAFALTTDQKLRGNIMKHVARTSLPDR